MKKTIWISVEEIPQCTPLMVSPVMKYMIQDAGKHGLGGLVHKYFSLFEKDTCQMCYPRADFDAQADFLSKKMTENPDWALKKIRAVEKWSKLFFREAAKFRGLPFSKLTKLQMLSAWKKPFRYHWLHHGLGALVSWHADAEKERITKFLLELLSRQMRKRGLRRPPAAVFATLSTPEKSSGTKNEEKDLLRLMVKRLKKNELKVHARKYEWLNYQYKGPAWDFKYFEDRVTAIRESGQNPKLLLSQMLAQEAGVRAEKKKLLKKLAFTEKQVKLFKMAEELVYIKNYRKEALYHGMYCYEPFFRELGRREGLSLDQVRSMNFWEIESLLRGRRVDANELNERLKFCVAWCDKNKYVVYTGDRAKKIVKSVRWETRKNRNGNEFSGTCAYPGKVRGEVRIINIPQEMKKMRVGDILVAHNTNPNLVPAMKKAAALISGAGGLTCHAAIVARELQIPCVVGVAGIDKILRDGDFVEVDANAGLVKKI